MNHTIGQRIRERRKLLKLTQTQLGKAVGVTKQAIYQWEKDLNKTFKEAEFDKLIIALKTTKSFLKTGVNSENNYLVSEPKTSESIVITSKKEMNLIQTFRHMADFQQDEWLAIGLRMAAEADKFRQALMPEFESCKK